MKVLPTSSASLTSVWTFFPVLKAIFRDQAWEELPEFMKLKVRPPFDTVREFFVLAQSDDHLCLLKHVYINLDKVSGRYVQGLLHGSRKEIAWGSQNKKVVRMLEQLGGRNSKNMP